MRQFVQKLMPCHSLYTMSHKRYLELHEEQNNMHAATWYLRIAPEYFHVTLHLAICVVLAGLSLNCSQRLVCELHRWLPSAGTVYNPFVSSRSCSLRRSSWARCHSRVFAVHYTRHSVKNASVILYLAAAGIILQREYIRIAKPSATIRHPAL